MSSKRRKPPKGSTAVPAISLARWMGAARCSTHGVGRAAARRPCWWRACQAPVLLASLDLQYMSLVRGGPGTFYGSSGTRCCSENRTPGGCCYEAPRSCAEVSMRERARACDGDAYGSCGRSCSGLMFASQLITKLAEADGFPRAAPHRGARFHLRDPSRCPTGPGVVWSQWLPRGSAPLIDAGDHRDELTRPVESFAFRSGGQAGWRQWDVARHFGVARSSCAEQLVVAQQ